MLKAWWLQLAAGESLENGPTPLRFLRSKTHVVPLGKARLAGGIRREYTPAACAAQHRYIARDWFGLRLLSSGCVCEGAADCLLESPVKPPSCAASRQSVEVTAESIFGAAARALSALRRDAWLDGIGPATRLGLNKFSPVAGRNAPLLTERTAPPPV